MEITDDQAKALAAWARAPITAYGSKFDAAYAVATEIATKIWEPCTEGCPGLAVFDANFELPEGYVHIERCDMCNRFESDEHAAASIVPAVGSYVKFACTICNDGLVITSRDMHSATFGLEDNHYSYRVVILEEFAKNAVEAGLLLPYPGYEED